MAKVCIGIDFGGTAIKFSALDADLTPGPVTSLPTPVEQGPQAVIDQIVAGANQLIEERSIARKDIVAVGIGSPGPLNIRQGILLALPNIPGMENLPLRDAVGEKLSLPATLENDANAAAFAEYLIGAGRGSQAMSMLTLGTGLGSGLIYHGQIIHGRHDMGGEVGHLIIKPGGRQCKCGQRGCLEQYCSAVNLARHTTLHLQKGEASSLQDVLAEKGSIDSRDINDARRAGDALAAKVWDECCYHLAIGCINLCHIFDPDRIVLAGGLSNAGDDLLEPVRKHWLEQNWTLFEQKTELAIATLGADAGAVGAAGVAWQVFGGLDATAA
jgi:glucokinase